MYKTREPKMRAVVKIASVVGVALLLNGYATTLVAAEAYSFDKNKQHIVQHYGGDYHYRPNHAWSYKLDKNSAHLNNVASGGLLTCKENDIWYISTHDRAEEKKIRYRYFISLSKFDLNDMKKDPTFIPRRDSKEFNALIEIDTQMVQQGLIGCSGKIPKGQIEKILPMSDAISIPSL